MAVTKTWSIRDLVRETSDDCITWVHWKITGTEDSNTVESTGITKLERPDNLVDYSSLSEETILGWVKAKINAESPAVRNAETGKTAVERYEEIMDKKIAALKSPETATGKPF